MIRINEGPLYSQFSHCTYIRCGHFGSFLPAVENFVWAVRFEHSMKHTALQGCVGGKCAQPPAKIFANGAQRQIKKPHFLLK